ncbi:alpha-L-rhamnosidase N-terminal domain-containing protein [Lutimonas saemankumensis]|uniref:alpha-L-rhamnosidase-related protein n=1 Tax=Lutimonas saemankumensis TaxID=483016 RepID=UPI001CD4017F|nr:alpha-L-rhamnosidase N-terminal domain-containing protein [Lutimonas saemankumensis]MCA0932464.1 alpha-L-rhamnosidase N-terminal domain-containing protein [Lutimonas saemankumensis]
MFKTKTRTYFYMILGFLNLGWAQISELPQEVQGIWSVSDSINFTNQDWRARWIWLPHHIDSDVMLARRSFNLNEIPSNSELGITASSKYELYINGKYLCQGPARSAPHHQSYDVLKITSALRRGKNTIGVRVHCQRGVKSYHLKGRAGLLVQLTQKDRDSTWSIISDENWKVFPDLSWDNNSPLMNRFQSVVNDRMDMNKKIQNFEFVHFDDSNWYQARPLKRNTGWPAPQKNEKATTLTTPWTSLVKRDIPYLKEDKLVAKTLIEARELSVSEIKSDSILLNGSIHHSIQKQLVKASVQNWPLQLPAADPGRAWFLLFDYGKVINGMPEFIIESQKEAEISVLSAPFMLENIFSSDIVASSYKDVITLSGKKDHWRAMYFKPTRYMAVIVKNNDPIKIHSLGIHQLKYPYELKGSITTPEAPWIEDLWQASAKTIDLCTTDAFTDNYRERRQYAQTGYYAALGNYFIFGDYLLQRRYLIQIAEEQQADGLMPAYAPLNENDFMIILDSNCFYIKSLYNYLLYSGDHETVRKLLPSANKLMQLLASYTNKYGMIDSPPYSYWLDHTLNDRRGANLTLNGHYLGALDGFSKVLGWLNEAELSKFYAEKADVLRSNLGRFLWDENKQLFADAYVLGKRSDQFSEHGNAMALACKIATSKQAEQIAGELLKKDKHNLIKRENGLIMVSPAMSYYLHKGLAEYGFEAESLEMLRSRFIRMLDPQSNGTLWEEWWRNGTGRTGKFNKRTRSDAQTESVFPPALFTKYVLGLEVVKPGFKEVKISKPTIAITNISGKIPSPMGTIGLKWKKKEKWQLDLTIPKGASAKFDEMQGEIRWKKKGDKKFVETDGIIVLHQGEYKITFDSSQEQ